MSEKQLTSNLSACTLVSAMELRPYEQESLIHLQAVWDSSANWQKSLMASWHVL